MSDRSSQIGPNPEQESGNRSEGNFERLAAILQTAQTGKTANRPEPPKTPQPHPTPIHTPVHENNITHLLPAPQRTETRIAAEREAIARTVALQQAVEQLTRVNGYLAEANPEAYVWLREQTKRVRGEYEAAKVMSDTLCGPSWEVTYYDGNVEDTDSDSIQVDAGKRDEDDYETRKKRPHCPKCGASGSSLTRRDGKSNRVLRSAWQCMGCGEEFDKADWKKPFFKSDADIATEKLEANRAAIRADFLAGQTCLHALTYLFEYRRGCEATMDDLDAMEILLQANQSCLQAFEYRNLDDALVEDIRKIRVRYVMGVAEAMLARKQKYTPKGALITAKGYAIAPPKNPVPLAVRRIKAVAAAEPYPRRKQQ